VGLPLDPGTSVAARTVQAWTGLFGLVGFELFGQTHGVVAHHEEFFGGAVERLGDLLGLPASG
jgi:hypothetical protein